MASRPLTGSRKESAVPPVKHKERSAELLQVVRLLKQLTLSTDVDRTTLHKAKVAINAIVASTDDTKANHHFLKRAERLRARILFIESKDRLLCDPLYRVRHVENAPTVLKGELSKQGMVKWRKRYFQQVGFRLFYFETAYSHKALGAIDLELVELITPSARENGFKVSTNLRTYHLQVVQTQGAHDVQWWMDEMLKWREFIKQRKYNFGQNNTMSPERQSENREYKDKLDQEIQLQQEKIKTMDSQIHHAKLQLAQQATRQRKEIEMRKQRAQDSLDNVRAERLDLLSKISESIDVLEEFERDVLTAEVNVEVLKYEKEIKQATERNLMELLASSKRELATAESSVTVLHRVKLERGAGIHRNFTASNQIEAQYIILRDRIESQKQKNRVQQAENALVFIRRDQLELITENKINAGESLRGILEERLKEIEKQTLQINIKTAEAQGGDEADLAKYQDLHRRYFHSLAVHEKFLRLQRNEQVNTNLSALYEEAHKIPIDEWPQWIRDAQ